MQPMTSRLLTPFRLAPVLLFALCAALPACNDDDGNAPCVPYELSDCPEDGCGYFDDGCGGILDCGVCDSGDCTPRSCPTNSCGTWTDGCDSTMECGECSGLLTCGGGAKVGYCGCTPKTCAELSQCGTDIDDGCGGTLSCGCDAPSSCQADGRCACSKFTCADLGNPNGEAYDGCGGFIQCSGSGSSTERIRVLAGNLTTSGSLTTSVGVSENFQETWDPGHGQRILQGLTPQVALLQEFKTLLYERERTGYWRNSDEALRDFVQTSFGDRYYAYRENRTGMNMGKPNGIVSYYPIKAAGEFLSALANIRDRQHVWTRIDIPGDRDLWVVSVHLTTGGSASGMSETNARKAEIEGLIADLESLNIPASDYLVIAGDFNISSRSEACMSSLRSSGLVYVDTEDSCPIDQSGNGDTNANRNEPYDGVFANSILKNHQAQITIDGAKNLSKRGLVFDSRKFTPLSAVSPVQYSDSNATDMQHMAVIKDFEIPR